MYEKEQKKNFVIYFSIQYGLRKQSVYSSNEYGEFFCYTMLIDMANIENTINKILEIIVNNKLDYAQGFYAFSSYEEERNRSIIICGKENIESYQKLYKELYKNIVNNKPISFESFQRYTQQLIIKNEFTKNNILKLITEFKESNVIAIRKIYGVSIKKRIIRYGKYTFVNKSFLSSYLNKIPTLSNDEVTKFELRLIKQETPEKQNFVYVLINFQTLDNIHTKYLMNNELSYLINAIRYMAFVQNDRYSIDVKPIHSYVLDGIQVIDNKYVAPSTELKIKDKTIYIDDAFFKNELKNKKIWKLISSSTKTDFEKRLTEAINWVGIALGEQYNYLVVTEIAFAFETLLFDDSEAHITKGIVANLSESYAFINFKDFANRIQAEKEFKEFYSKRSKISHGGRILSKDETPINTYFNMIDSTITNLLNSKRFIKVRNGQKKLFEIIQKLRYA